MMQEPERRRVSASTSGGSVARTAVELHLRAVLTADDTEALMLDFMQPQAPRRAACRPL
jgi:hypothetical protein